MSLKANTQALAHALAPELPVAVTASSASMPAAVVGAGEHAAAAKITLHIERLALPGYSRNEANRLVQGFEQALQLQLAGQSWPQQAQQLSRLSLPASAWRPAERPEQRGQRLALLLAAELEGS